MSSKGNKALVAQTESDSKPIQNNSLTVENILKPLLSGLNSETNFEVSRRNNRTTIKVDSYDGLARTIITVENQGSLNMATVSQITKPSVQERRKIVSKLYDEGKSQTEIANIAMVSQKTISNDLKKINSSNS
ncbi:helix-turn-helix domain-containing protein [Aliarcobacter skirrowii]|uniref:hypothetical protein n=1 Tax=Aliarcobacter skirrowii TaxID=28200 RepID=UPI00082E5436|nr:hypothetical protein [Aliarcobacter skirrowii]